MGLEEVIMVCCLVEGVKVVKRVKCLFQREDSRFQELSKKEFQTYHLLIHLEKFG